MKYKLPRAVEFQFHNNPKEEKQAIRALLAVLHEVKNLQERKEVSNDKEQ